LNGPVLTALWNTPLGVEYSKTSKSLYVADSQNHCIRKIKDGIGLRSCIFPPCETLTMSVVGVVTTLTGTPTVSGFADGGADVSLFVTPSFMSKKRDHLYITEPTMGRIRYP
jgi:hypothetical protein